MAIVNWAYHGLHLDYSSMYEGAHPSDIDMFYLYDDDTLLIGEIKNCTGKYKRGQRMLHQRLIDGREGDGLILYITHDKFYQNGDRRVDVPECYVRQIYYKNSHRWVNPLRPTKVREVLEYYARRAKENGDK